MASGIKRSANRPKQAKHLRASRGKKFRNEDPAKLAEYKAKMAARASRKDKRRRRKGK